jgi:hypothetical protein
MDREFPRSTKPNRQHEAKQKGSQMTRALARLRRQIDRGSLSQGHFNGSHDMLDGEMEPDAPGKPARVR